MITVTQELRDADPADLSDEELRALNAEMPATVQIMPVSIDLIDANRYQKRKPDPESVAPLAENIKAHGLKQYPIGRMNPDNPERVELGGGHRRVAAYRLLAKTDPFYKTIPVTIVLMTDRELYETCVIENEQRAPLSAIERGRTLIDYLTEFKVTQAEAGKLFTDERGRPLGQSAVSHLVSLVRELPADVQELVHRGELPERAARALLPLVHWAGQPKAVSGIAKQALEEEPGDRADRVSAEIDNLLQRKGQTLADWKRPWPITWPELPLAVDYNRKEKGEPSEIPACRGCSFAIIRGRQAYCLRQPCFDLKQQAWQLAEVAAAAAKLGIPPAAAGETVTVVFAGSYDPSSAKAAAKLVRAKLPELRLAPNPKSQAQSIDYGLADVTGSKDVILVTTSRMAVEKYLADTKGKGVVAPKSKNETPAQKEKRVNADKELAEERKLERMALNRRRADVLWLLAHTAELIAARTVASGGLLAWAVGQADNHNTGMYVSEVNEARRVLRERADIDRPARHVKPAEPALDAIRRTFIAYSVVANEVVSYKNPAQVYGDWEHVHDTAQETAADVFSIELPAGWDVPPIHHTPINCWECGRFSASANGKLTKADLAEGWRAVYDSKDGRETKDSKLQSVKCPDHSYHHGPKSGRYFPGATPQEVARAELPKSRKPTPNGRAAAAATAGAVALAAKVKGGKDDRGHTRPAPKPAGTKAKRKTVKKGK